MARAGQILKQALIRLLRYPHRLLPGALRRHRRLPAFADGTTFGELLERAWQLAGHWAGCGLSSGDRVLIDLPNDSTLVESRIAAILGGFVAVPVPPGTDNQRLGWIAEFCEAGAYLGPRCGELPGISAVAVAPLAGDRDGYESALASASPLERTPPIRGDHLLTINFTSGTTGEPKGVMSTAFGWGWSLYHALGENRVPPGRDEVFLHAIPLATAGSTLILPAVLSGAKSLFLWPWDAWQAAEWVQREAVTRLFLTPTMLAEFIDAVRASRADTSSLRSVIYGTEAIPAARIRKAIEALGPVLQQGYGMAEALPPVCMLHPDEHARAVADGDVELLSSVGRPTRAVELRVCDDSDRPIPAEEVGSIRIRGPTVSPGYWKRPDLTARSRREGFYVAEDIGSMNDRGYLRVFGRELRVPSEPARRVVEWAETRSDVCLAWAEEESETLVLNAVPARGREPDTAVLEREAQRVLGRNPVVAVQFHREAPKTPSYKLKTLQRHFAVGFCNILK